MVSAQNSTVPILGIAAIKLGAERMIGIDIDPQALEASLDNAQRNGVADKLEVYLPENQPEFSADIVVANIFSAAAAWASQYNFGIT